MHGQPDMTRRSRRVFLAGALGAPAALCSATWMANRSAAQTEIGNCFDEPAFELFYAWDSGQLVYPGPGESAPPLHWEATNLPGGDLPWFIPPGWSVETLVAENIERDGSIDWRQRVNGLPLLGLTRVMSDDGSAIFETALGTIDGYVLYLREVADMAVGSLLGMDTRLRNVCYVDNEGMVQGPVWRLAATCCTRSGAHRRRQTRISHRPSSGTTTSSAPVARWRA